MAYTTKADALDYCIKPALGDFVEDFDLDAIFDDFFRYDEQERGFVERDDVDFWDVAESHDVSGE